MIHNRYHNYSIIFYSNSNLRESRGFLYFLVRVRVVVVCIVCIIKIVQFLNKKNSFSKKENRRKIPSFFQFRKRNVNVFLCTKTRIYFGNFFFRQRLFSLKMHISCVFLIFFFFNPSSGKFSSCLEILKELRNFFFVSCPR